MPARAPYRRSVDRPAETRRRIVEAVHDLLAERKFHECTVEDVADRAGVSRATLYLHFRSRLDLINAVCDVMGVNPALVELRRQIDLADPDEALAETIAHAVRFWESEDGVLSQLYDVVAVDPAASDFVARQYADRRNELERLVRNLRRARRLQPGLGDKRALATLLLLTSYASYRELRQAGMSEREATRLLQENARSLLLDG